MTLHALVLRLVALVPDSSVNLLLGFSAILSVSLVSRLTARSLHVIMCLGVKRHLASGHEISTLQHGLQLIMARYTHIINCRPCCNLYILAYNLRCRRRTCATRWVKSMVLYTNVGDDRRSNKADNFDGRCAVENFFVGWLRVNLAT